MAVKTTTEPYFKRLDKIHKTDGDYVFVGRVVTPYHKLRSGELRYIVEDDRGLNLIMNERVMKPGWPDGA